jgi:hypothetical protein
MLKQRFTAFVALVTAAGAAACSGGADALTAPSASPARAATASLAATAPASWAGQTLTTAQLNTLLESEKRRIAAAQEASKPTYDALKTEWEGFLATNPSPTASPFLMCDPLQYAADTKIIGPEGGDMSVGPHKLSVPRGALRVRTVITAEMPTSLNVQVRFRPHGLVFNRQAQPRLELSYKHCYRPQADAKSIAYVNDAMQATEWRLTTDRAADGLAQATIEHFSGYVIAWGRSRTQPE